jgi:hypothetical protein
MKLSHKGHDMDKFPSATLLAVSGFLVCSVLDAALVEAAPPLNGIPASFDDRVEYFPAGAFLRGFSVSPPTISNRIPLSKFGQLAPMRPEAQGPFWTLIHWCGVESLSDAHRVLFSEQKATWRNAYQGLQITTDEKGHAAVSLSIDSLAIYNHDPITYERMGVVRPHFLLSHNFYPDLDEVRRYCGAEDKDTTPDGGVFPDLDTFSELTLAMTLRLVEAVDLRHKYHGDDPANRRLHYNRNPFQFWFQVYCRNPEDPAHGRFFWLGCRVFDSEQPYSSSIPHELDQIESDGIATFAYRLSDLSIHGTDYARLLADLRGGKETPISIDILQATRKAIHAIQREKHDFLAARDSLAGYTLSSFNIGWEPASPFRGTMVITGLSLRGSSKEAGPRTQYEPPL